MLPVSLSKGIISWKGRKKSNMKVIKRKREDKNENINKKKKNKVRYPTMGNDDVFYNSNNRRWNLFFNQPVVIYFILFSIIKLKKILWR
jgi:hypothetical protein